MASSLGHRCYCRIVEGLLQKAYFGALPDVALSGVAGVLQDGCLKLTPEQEQGLGAELGRLRDETLENERAGRTAQGAIESLVERETMAGPSRARAGRLLRGGIAVFFLLFSAVRGALLPRPPGHSAGHVHLRGGGWLLTG